MPRILKQHLPCRHYVNLAHTREPSCALDMQQVSCGVDQTIVLLVVLTTGRGSQQVNMWPGDQYEYWGEAIFKFRGRFRTGC